MEMYGLTYKEALDRIISDFNCNIDIIQNNNITVKKKERKEERPKLFYVTKKYNKEELDYWLSYGIKKETLDYFNVKSVSYYNSSSSDKIHFSFKFNPIFAYLVKDKVKLYKPKGNFYEKWRTNIVDEIQGLEQLRYEKDILIITKSLKDVMVLYEIGIEAIALNSEHEFISNELYDELKSRYKKIILLLDNDKTGIEASSKHAKQHHIQYYYFGLKSRLDIYKTKGIKDCADFVKVYNSIALLKHLKRNIYD